MCNVWALVTGMVVAYGMAVPSDAYEINTPGTFGVTEYYTMPPLYKMDDYDRCLEEGTAKIKATYCVTYTQILPNNTSPLWKMIAEFSAKNKHHFRHDRLNRGICLQWCKPFFDDFISSTKQKHIQEEIKNEIDIKFNPDSITRRWDDCAKYNKLVDMCVNKELKTGYNLMAYSTVGYCITNLDTHVADSLDWLFVWICVGLLIVLISSSMYDFFLRRRNLEHNNSMHYQVPVEGKYASVMVSFSVSRNWYVLMAKPSSQIIRDLRPINALRSVTMCTMILGHGLLYMNIVPTLNPQEMEKNYYNILMQMWINCTVVIHTFFTISGYLMSTKFMNMRKTQKFSLHYFWKGIILRYIRLTPVYVWLLLFNATWLITIRDGPVWPYVAGTERSNCRKNGWTNLLYVNNIFGISEPCLQHGWYLAAEFQMFIMGITMHLIFWKFPKSTKTLLSIAVLASYVVPGIVIYSNQFEGVFMATLEKQRHAHWIDKMYASFYVPSYTNFGSYICGMIGGILYCKYRQPGNNTRPRGFKVLVVIWYLIPLIGFILVLSGIIFYHYDFNKPALWIALYSSGVKSLWGVLIATFITGIALGIGWIIREAMSYPAFRPLGQLTYCACLVHPIIMRITLGDQRQPLYNSILKLYTNAISLVVLSYIAALILCLCIELPVTSLTQWLFSTGFRTAKSTEPKKETTVEIIPTIQNE